MKDHIVSVKEITVQQYSTFFTSLPNREELPLNNALILLTWQTLNYIMGCSATDELHPAGQQLQQQHIVWNKPQSAESSSCIFKKDIGQVLLYFNKEKVSWENVNASDEAVWV